MERRSFISKLSLFGLGTLKLTNLNITPRETGNISTASGHNVYEEETLMLSVKVIKSKPGFCTEKPVIEFPSSNKTWFSTSRLNKDGDFDGENLREIYFNIQSGAAKFSPVQLDILAPGIEAARVIVGYTDVPFEQTKNGIHFKIVDDRSRGQLMQIEYQSPLGGYPIAFIHNWNIRKAGKYAHKEFPAIEFASILNYLMAAQEVLRQMGDMGPGDPKPFKGEIVLMGSEVASTRGHMDYPPHFHIMLYEFGKIKYKDWITRLVPHFYMDKSGNIVHDSYVRLAGNGTGSGEYGPGDVVSFKDSRGKHVLDLIVNKKGGLILRHPDGRSYSIRPDPKKGASNAVYGYYGDKVICRAQVRDHPDMGTFIIKLNIFNNGKSEKVIHDGYLYDPFTAHNFRRLYSSSLS